MVQSLDPYFLSPLEKINFLEAPFNSFSFEAVFRFWFFFKITLTVRCNTFKNDYLKKTIANGLWVSHNAKLSLQKPSQCDLHVICFKHFLGNLGQKEDYTSSVSNLSCACGTRFSWQMLSEEIFLDNNGGLRGS